MRSLLSFLLLYFAGIVAAVSSSGSRLLVVLEDAAEKSKYSRFWKDLEGKADFLCFIRQRLLPLAIE